MTGIQIKQAAENYCDEAIEDDEALTAINRALTIIGDRAHIYKAVRVVVTPSEVGRFINLPAEITSVREVRTDAGEPYDRYTVLGSSVRFADEGTYVLTCRRMPAKMSGILDTPDVHPLFREALVTYVAAWWKLKDDDESPDGLRLMQEFERLILRVDATLSRGRGPKQWRVVRHA